jgi:hypothetical protein
MTWVRTLYILNPAGFCRHPVWSDYSWGKQGSTHHLVSRYSLMPHTTASRRSLAPQPHSTGSLHSHIHGSVPQPPVTALFPSLRPQSFAQHHAAASHHKSIAPHLSQPMPELHVTASRNSIMLQPHGKASCRSLTKQQQPCATRPHVTSSRSSLLPQSQAKYH